MAFKMKGSPMQRNFGVGTSFKQTDEDLKEYLKKNNLSDMIKKTVKRESK